MQNGNEMKKIWSTIDSSIVSQATPPPPPQFCLCINCGIDCAKRATIESGQVPQSNTDWHACNAVIERMEDTWEAMHAAFRNCGVALRVASLHSSPTYQIINHYTRDLFSCDKLWFWLAFFAFSCLFCDVCDIKAAISPKIPPNSHQKAIATK